METESPASVVSTPLHPICLTRSQLDRSVKDSEMLYHPTKCGIGHILSDILPPSPQQLHDTYARFLRSLLILVFLFAWFYFESTQGCECLAKQVIYPSQVNLTMKPLDTTVIFLHLNDRCDICMYSTHSMLGLI